MLLRWGLLDGLESTRHEPYLVLVLIFKTRVSKMYSAYMSRLFALQPPLGVLLHRTPYLGKTGLCLVVLTSAD